MTSCRDVAGGPFCTPTFGCIGNSRSHQKYYLFRFACIHFRPMTLWLFLIVYDGCLPIPCQWTRRVAPCLRLMICSIPARINIMCCEKSWPQ